MNVRFGDWELRKMDTNNWELYHFGIATGRGSNNSDGKPRWRGTGRYYQENTLRVAIEYAIDWDNRNDDSDDTVDLLDYLRAFDESAERRMAAFNGIVLTD